MQATGNIFNVKFIIPIVYSLIVNESLAFFNGLYEKPWARLSPYILGICIGFILHKIDGKIEVSIITMSCGM